MGLEDDSRQVITWGIIKKLDVNCDINLEYSSSSSSSINDSSSDDDIESSSSTSSNSCEGPLFQLADLMSQLPIKRGLSKYYHGKSQTFGSLESVKSVEDLGKKETTSSYSRRMKSSCKGKYLNHRQQRKVFGPKATIAKKRSSPKRPFSPSLTSAKATGTMLVA